MLRIPLLALSLLGLVACSSTPQQVNRVDARPLTPAANEIVVVDQLLVIVDSSSSLDDEFLQERALLETYIASAPEGQYDAGAVAFGGFERESYPLAPFQRQQLRANASQIEHLEAGTPLYKVLAEAQDSFAGRSGQAAVVIFSDGLVTDEFGREIENERTLSAARELASSYGDTICFHTVQVGDSEVGAELLRSISDVTGCGSTRNATAAGSESQLHAFHRQVFLGTLPPVAAAPPAPVAAGPWSILFGFDSAVVDATHQDELQEIAEQVQATPGSRVVIKGHTDASGGDDYNLRLSERRSEATAAALIGAGIQADRIVVEAFGEADPVFPNDDERNRKANRRTEIELVR
jgi:outer membrane protein OmpA-like peptidoglycan-associated protein